MSKRIRQPHFMVWPNSGFTQDLRVQALTQTQSYMMRALIQNAFVQPTAPLIPNAPAALAILAECKPWQWDKNGAAILAAGFRVVDGGEWLTHPILEEAVAHMERKSEINREKGKRSGEVRAAAAESKVERVMSAAEREEYESDGKILLEYLLTRDIAKGKAAMKEEEKQEFLLALGRIYSGSDKLEHKFSSGLLLVVCNTDNWFVNNPFARAKTQKSFIQSFITNWDAMAKEDKLGGLVRKWVNGDTTALELWDGKLIVNDDGSYSWEQYEEDNNYISPDLTDGFEVNANWPN